jgi:hypothetical protein
MKKLLLLLFACSLFFGAQAQTSIKNVGGTFFTVQVGSFLSMPSMSSFSSYSQPVNHEVNENGMNRISLGRFKSFGEAERFLAKLKSRGRFSDSFITAYQDGAKITIAQAKQMMGSDPASAEREAANAKAENMNDAQQASDEEAAQLAAAEEAERKAAEEAAAKAEAERVAAEEQAAKEEADRKAAEEAAVAKAEEEKAAQEAEAQKAAEADAAATEQAKADAEKARQDSIQQAEAQAAEQAAAKAKEDSLYEAKAKEEAAAEAAQLAAEKAKADSLEAAKQKIPEGLAVVHHDTKTDSEGQSHEFTEKDGVMVEDGEEAPATEAKAETPAEARAEPPKEEPKKMSAIDSMLAMAAEQKKADEAAAAANPPKEPVNRVFSIKNKKILFRDTIADRISGPEFVYNLKKGDQLIISADEVKGKAFKGYRVWRYDNSMKKFDKDLPVGESDVKTASLAEEMVNINRDGVYKVKLIQPNNSFRKMSVLIEKRSKEEANLLTPFNTNKERSFVYVKNNAGKTAINTSVKAYFQRKKNAGSEYSPSDIFIHEDEISDFGSHTKRGEQYALACCASSKEYNRQFGIDRPLTNLYKFSKGDTILVEFSQLTDAKGNTANFKSIQLRRYGSEESIYSTKDVGGKRFAFIAGNTGYYEVLFDTYAPTEYSVTGLVTRLPFVDADPNFKNEVVPEMIPVYFYEYNSFTKNEDLKFAIAPKPHVTSNISEK